jgi:hypothetical protein
MDASIGSSSTAGYVDFKAISSAAIGVLDTIVPLILPGGYRKGREWIVRNPTRNDATPGSFSVNLQTGIWVDFATDATGGDGGGRGAGGRGADHGDGVGRSGDADGGRRGGGIGVDLGDDDSYGDGHDCGGGGLGRGGGDGVDGGGRGGDRGRDSGAGGGGHHCHGGGGGGRASGRDGAGPGDDFDGGDSRRRDGGGGGLGRSSGDGVGREGGRGGVGRGGHGGADVEAQTIFPGSVQESGEDIKWAEAGDPAHADDGDLLGRSHLLASLSLMARYRPGKGGPHDAALTIDGFLSRCGYTPSDIKCFVECVAKIAGCEDCEGRSADAEDMLKARLHGSMDRLFGKVVADQIAEWLDHERGGLRVRHAPDGAP